MTRITIIHDWDFPLYKPSTCLKTSLWLLGYFFLGRFKRYRNRMPETLLKQKLSYMQALIQIDQLYGVKPVWGITDQVLQAFPEAVKLLEQNGQEIRYHYHNKQKQQGKGRWLPSLQVEPENMIYDRLYMQGKTELPESTTVVWHVDHIYNLPWYIKFLEKCKEEGRL